MDIPNFDEFRSSLTEEKVAEMFSGGIRRHYVINDLSNPDNVSAFISDFAFQVVSQCSKFTINLLEHYHEWLQEQLD